MAKRDEIIKLTKISNKNFVDIMNNLKWKIRSVDMTWKDNIDISSIYKVKDVQSLPLVTFIGTDCELSIDIEKFTLIGNGGNFVFFFKDNTNGDCLTISFEDDNDGDALMDRLANAGYIKESKKSAKRSLKEKVTVNKSLKIIERALLDLIHDDTIQEEFNMAFEDNGIYDSVDDMFEVSVHNVLNKLLKEHTVTVLPF